MRLSDRYIGRQVLVGTLFAILLLSTILLMGSLFQSLRMLIVDLGAPLPIVGEFLLATAPFALIYTIPWAFLSAVLLVFGRLSSDNELTGFRVAGMSLSRLSLPVFAIGALLSAGCLWLNLRVAPAAKMSSKNIEKRAFSMDPRSMLTAAAEQDGLARFEESLKNVRAYIERSNDNVMEGFHLFRTAEPGEDDGADIYVHAMKAKAVIDKEKGEFRLHLYDAVFQTTETDETTGKTKPLIIIAEESVPVVLPYETNPSEKDDPATMSNAEIRTKIEGLKQQQVEMEAQTVKLRERLAAMDRNDPADAKLRQVLENDLKRKQLFRWTAFIPNYEAEIHRRYASSLACLAFAFIGVPLGIKARRKDTSSGLVLSLLIGAAYFLCGMIGGKTTAGVQLAAWAPNVACVLLGLFLLRRARFR